MSTVTVTDPIKEDFKTEFVSFRHQPVGTGRRGGAAGLIPQTTATDSRTF